MAILDNIHINASRLDALVAKIIAKRARLVSSGNIDAATIGFFGATPIARPSAYTQAYATADKTHDAVTSNDLSLTSTQSTPWGFSSQAEADSIQTEVNALRAELIDLKQFVNAILDDLQALGLLQ